MKTRIKALLVGVALTLGAVVMTACVIKEADLNNGKYDLGEASLAYCSATSQAQRDALRAALNFVASAYGVTVGVDYCKAFALIKDGYDVGDVSKAWCSAADPAVRLTIRKAFSKLLDAEGVTLTDAYCGVADYVKAPE